MTLWSEVERRRFSQIEKRLNEIGSMVKGNQAFQAERIADVMEQIAELREEFKTVSARVSTVEDRMERVAKFCEEIRSERKNGD